jgi:hypothetical protein
MGLYIKRVSVLLSILVIIILLFILNTHIYKYQENKNILSINVDKKDIFKNTICIIVHLYINKLKAIILLYTIVFIVTIVTR